MTSKDDLPIGSTVWLNVNGQNFFCGARSATVTGHQSTPLTITGARGPKVWDDGGVKLKTQYGDESVVPYEWCSHVGVPPGDRRQ